MKVKLLHLLTGEDIVCEVIAEMMTITIKRPMIVLYNPENNQIALRPWVIFTSPDNEIEINQTAVTYTAEPIDEIANLYRQATGKVVLPKQGLILPQ